MEKLVSEMTVSELRVLFADILEEKLSELFVKHDYFAMKGADGEPRGPSGAEL